MSLLPRINTVHGSKDVQEFILAHDTPYWSITPGDIARNFCCMYASYGLKWEFTVEFEVFRLADLYAIMKNCEKLEQTKGVFPNTSCIEGGFCWEGTARSVEFYYMNTGYEQYVDQQIRLYHVGCLMPFLDNATAANWKRAFLNRKDFYEDTWNGQRPRNNERSRVVFSPRCGVPVNRFIGLLKAVHMCKFDITETHEFKVAKMNGTSQWKISSTPNKTNKFLE
jgi:hypothetical protein